MRRRSRRRSLRDGTGIAVMTWVARLILRRGMSGSADRRLVVSGDRFLAGEGFGDCGTPEDPPHYETGPIK